jgi:hypothetical protein
VGGVWGAVTSGPADLHDNQRGSVSRLPVGARGLLCGLRCQCWVVHNCLEAGVGSQSDLGRNFVSGVSIVTDANPTIFAALDRERAQESFANSQGSQWQNGYMGEKRRMHTVPRCYLEPFATTKGRRTPAVWRYERTSRESIAISIEYATVHKDIYAFADDGGERSTAIEDVLMEIEGHFCDARLKLVSGEALTLDERRAISNFVSFQLSRTPRALQLQRDEFAHSMKRKALALAADPQQFHAAMRQDHESDEECEAGRQAMLSGNWHYESDPFTGLHAMMSGVADLSQWVLLMHWTLYSSDGSYCFLTSDNPATMWATRYHNGHLARETGVGFADRDVTISLPISPSLCLVARHTTQSFRALEATNDVDRHTLGLRGWRPQLQMLPAKTNQIKILNHACVINADRYIFHGERDRRIEAFLEKSFFGQPGPVRRRDYKPVGSAS